MSAPLVSVVYVTHGGLDWLRRSLAALTANTDPAPEVIVVDSASPDDTAARLRELDGVRLVLLDENVGFGRGCNAGVDAARGRFVCLLNVDAMPEPGWLPPLLERLEEPRVGAVFPMLLNLDGSVQEAGSVVDALGWAHTIGAGADPDELGVRFTRPIDFGSAACMLVERALFRSLDGFDPVYGLGYYEDADFCFKLREAGLRAYYEPRSRVVHARHGSSTGDRARELMLANRGHFYGRWARALADRPRTTEIETNPRHAIAARDADALDRILVIDDRVPFADRGSGDPRMAKLLIELADLYPDARITLLAAIPDEAERYAGPLLERGVEVACEPGRWGEWFSERLFHYSLVIISRPQNFERFDGWLGQTQPQALRVYDIEALSSRQWERKELFAANEEERHELRLLAGRTRILEAETIRRSDALFCVSAEEAERALEHEGGKPAFVVPSPVEVVDAPATFDERAGLVFFGGFLAGTGSPNEDAVLFLAQSVMPLVWEGLPDVTLTVIGADVTPAVRALDSDRIHVVGYVDDPLEWLGRARVHASPIRFGAGIKLKLLDSMAAGLPFVTTPAGAEGLHVERVVDLVTADAPVDLARLITALYTDQLRWESVQRVLLHAAETHFSRAAFRRALVEALSHVGVAPPAAAWTAPTLEEAAP